MLAKGLIKPAMFSKCDHDLMYDWRYGAKFCPTCDEWREVLCPYPCCEYCTPRPAKPSDAGPISLNKVDEEV